MSGFREFRAGDTVKFLVPAGTGRNGVEYKDSTLDIMFSDTSKTIACLRERGHKI